MVQRVGNTTLAAREAEARASEVPIADTSPILTGLESHIETCWQAALTHHKDDIKPRLLNCLRRRDGKYDIEKAQQIEALGSAPVYFRETSRKCSAAKAWIRDITLPVSDHPWGLEPTPIPELPGQVMQNIVEQVMRQAIQMAAQTGEMPTQDQAYQMGSDMAAQVREAMKNDAKERARLMQERIDDQFLEGDFKKAFTEVIDDITTFPSAIFKGSIIERRKTLTWDNANGFTPVVAVKEQPVWKRVSPFDFFPSPQCDSPNDGYLLERIRYNRTDLAEMRGMDGWSEEAINDILTNAQTGVNNDVEPEEQERADLEMKELNSAPGTSDDKIAALEFWGSVQGFMLSGWGLMPVDSDPNKQYEICATKVGGRVIRAIINPNPLGRRPYYVTSYEKVPGSIWGIAIPEIIAATQDGINSVFRGMIDNIGFAAGPQLAVDIDKLAPGQDATKIFPRKIWYLQKLGMQGGNGLPIEFFQPDMNVRQLLAAFSKFQELSDDQSGIPRYSYGNENVGGAGETASGLSMLMNAASKGIRQVITNVGSDMIAPAVQDQYTWNMLYLQDQSIKGDVRVTASGAMAIIMREQLRSQRWQFANATMNDLDSNIMGVEGRRKLLSALATDTELPGVVPDEAELKMRMQAEQEAMAVAQQQQAIMESAGAGAGAPAPKPKQEQGPKRV